jgi:hypothetical protein
LMSVPSLIAAYGQYLLSSNVNIARPTANISGSGGGTAQTAQGYVNVLVTDFGTTLELVPNRLQQSYGASICDLFFIDTARVALCYLKGYTTRPLAKLGLSERSQMSVDWTVQVYAEKAHGAIRDINPATAIVT